MWCFFCTNKIVNPAEENQEKVKSSSSFQRGAGEEGSARRVSYSEFTAIN